MNNKGFTLVELLLTISILGILVVLGGTVYSSISENVRESQRKNLISNIESMASKYAFDTKETKAFVKTLVDTGYLEADDDEGNIIDPIDNTELNCYVVEMEKVNDYYKAKFTDTKYTKAGGCDEEKLKNNMKEINITVKNGSSYVENLNEYLTNSVELRAVGINGLVVNCSIGTCTWTSTSGANISGQDYVTLTNKGKLNTVYTFQYSIKNNETNNIDRYSKSVSLKLNN